MGDMKMDAGMMDEMAAKKKANTDRITSLMAQVKSAIGRCESRGDGRRRCRSPRRAHGHGRALRVDDVDDEEMIGKIPRVLQVCAISARRVWNSSHLPGRRASSSHKSRDCGHSCAFDVVRLVAHRRANRDGFGRGA